MLSRIIGDEFVEEGVEEEEEIDDIMWLKRFDCRLSISLCDIGLNLLYKNT